MFKIKQKSNFCEKQEFEKEFFPVITKISGGIISH